MSDCLDVRLVRQPRREESAIAGHAGDKKLGTAKQLSSSQFNNIITIGNRK